MPNRSRYEFQMRHFGFSGVQMDDFYIFKKSLSKKLFLTYRVFVFMYWTAGTIAGTVEYVGLEDGWLYYVYLSHWGEWILVLNFGASLAVGLHEFYRTKATDEDKDSEGRSDSRREGKLRWYHCACWILQSISTTVAYAVTVMFWTLLGSAPLSSKVVNIHRHVINSCLVTVDVFARKFPVRILHFIYPVMFGLVYTSFTAIIHLAGVVSEIYPKNLDWASEPLRTLVVVGLVNFVVFPVLHCLIFGLYQVKVIIWKKFAKSEQTLENPVTDVDVAKMQTAV